MRVRMSFLLAVLLLGPRLGSAQSTSIGVDADAHTPWSVLASVHECRTVETVVERAWREAWAGAARDGVASGPTLRWLDAVPAGPGLAPEPQRRPKAIEYSAGYETRQKIHRYASLATLPLAVTEMALGQSLYTNPSDGKRGAHLAVATGLGGLFAVNSVTGVWNLLEGRKDPNGRTRRTLHGVLMLAADAGFLATAALAPEGEHEFEHERSLTTGSIGTGRARHRAVAFTSLGTAVASYLMMLLWRP